MLDEVRSHPLTVDVQLDGGPHYDSLEHMVEDASKLGCDTVVNCAGLGSSDICDDSDLRGGRGALLRYDRRTCHRHDVSGLGEGEVATNDAVVLVDEEPWGSVTEQCYLIPRGDSLLVGGTHLLGDSEAGLREDERSRLTQNARILGIDTDRSDPAGEWVGFRPCRSRGVRLEIDRGGWVSRRGGG